jgi:hypothetical protein
VSKLQQAAVSMNALQYGTRPAQLFVLVLTSMGLATVLLGALRLL